MGAPKGNEYYKLRAKSGREKKYKTPTALWKACCIYFQFVDENPLQEEKLFCNKEGILRDDVAKRRAMTLAGLRVHLGLSPNGYKVYRKRDEFKWVTETVDDIMYAQKFEGAAAGLLNPNIIARDLGLADKSEFTGKDGAPIETITMDPKSYKKARKEMLEDDDC